MKIVEQCDILHNAHKSKKGENSVYCRECKKAIPDDATECPLCGAKQGKTKICPTCGERIPFDSVVCPGCGAKQKDVKYCKHCGAVIASDCVVCPKCGRQVEELQREQAQAAQPQIVINNSNNNSNVNTNMNGGPVVVMGRAKNKWVALLLCIFLGYLGIHKFYEGRVGWGLLYLFTVGLGGIGWIIDCIILLFKPNPYYV